MGPITKAINRKFANAKTRKMFITGIDRGLAVGSYNGPGQRSARKIMGLILERLRQSTEDPAELATIARLAEGMKAAEKQPRPKGNPNVIRSGPDGVILTPALRARLEAERGTLADVLAERLIDGVGQERPVLPDEHPQREPGHDPVPRAGGVRRARRPARPGGTPGAGADPL